MAAVPAKLCRMHETESEPSEHAIPEVILRACLKREMTGCFMRNEPFVTFRVVLNAVPLPMLKARND
ncbi:hypothetical protein EA58_20715 [Photobacterium galatheae]|uniref:Uncharacterized protein n=1 Tax=Photobacterium galatheae TaxID=1654360 RepID=A0A066RHE6_9GAMM|nr:hypothetical protein EA58_20715 [Photobacterium galatheae]